MMTDAALKPCPFCGGCEVYLDSTPVIVCPDCAAMGPAEYSTRDWNTRQSPKVRKLVWKRVADNSWVSGSYTITEKREKFNVTFYTGPVQGLMAVGMREGLESAQAAAQADYKARILGALE